MVVDTVVDVFLCCRGRGLAVISGGVFLLAHYRMCHAGRSGCSTSRARRRAIVRGEAHAEAVFPGACSLPRYVRFRYIVQVRTFFSLSQFSVHFPSLFPCRSWYRTPTPLCFSLISPTSTHARTSIFPLCDIANIETHKNMHVQKHPHLHQHVHTYTCTSPHVHVR